MAAMDDAENARAALRALWSMSGQMDEADSLGKEKELSNVTIPTGSTSDGKGGEGGGFGSERHGQLGFSAYQEGTHDPTFDRHEAATKFKEAWKSQLAMDGKLGGKPLSESAAKKTPKELERP